MPYEVCYRALLSISVVEATHDGRAPPDRPIHGTMAHGSAPPLAGPRATLDHPQDRRSPPGLGLAGGPPARWFVIYSYAPQGLCAFVCGTPSGKSSFFLGRGRHVDTTAGLDVRCAHSAS